MFINFIFSSNPVSLSLIFSFFVISIYFCSDLYAFFSSANLDKVLFIHLSSCLKCKIRLFVIFLVSRVKIILL